MRKLLGMAAVGLCLTVIALPEVSQVEAQVKDKGKDKGAAKVGTVEVYKSKDGYRFRIKDNGGKIIGISVRGQESKDDVVGDLDAIKETLNKVKPEVKD